MHNIDEIFAMAEQIERNGARFYRRASELARDEGVASLLGDLAAWEEGHQRAFAGIRRRVAAARPEVLPEDPGGEAERYLASMAGSHVFGPDRQPEDLLGEAPSVEEILELALRFERDSILFFVGMKATVPADLGAAEVDRLIREEIKHISTLEEARERRRGDR